MNCLRLYTPTLLEEVMDSFSGHPTSLVQSPVNITEEDDQYVVQVECPGVDKKDLSILYQDNILTIKGAKTDPSNGAKSLVNRIRYGNFQTSYRIPDIDIEKGTSRLDNGILTITLPKSSQAKPFTIPLS